MSKDLPLWEEDESDVKVEYRLQYGHVIIVSYEINNVLRKIRSGLRLKKPISTDKVINLKKLPLDEKGKVTTLEDEKEWHFVLVRNKSIISVFGPHRQFFSSKNWIKVCRKLRTLIAFVTQTNLNYFFYNFFFCGRHKCNAYQNTSGIREAVVGPVDVYFDGEPIYKYREEKGKLTEEMKKLISEDIIIQIDKQKEVRFKRPLSENEFVEPDEICHAVFKAKIQEDNNHRKDTRNIPNPIDILIEKIGGLFVK